MGVRNFVDISRSHNRAKGPPPRPFYFDSWHNRVAAKVDERKGKRVPFSIIKGHHNSRRGGCWHGLAAAFRSAVFTGSLIVNALEIGSTPRKRNDVGINY